MFKIYDKVVYFMFYVAIFAFAGVINLAFVQWDWGSLLTPAYWFSTLSSTAIYLAAYQITVNLSADIATENSTQYQAIKTDLDKQTNRASYPDLRAFTNLKNKAAKEVAWQTQTQNKLTKLINRTPDKIKADADKPIKISKMRQKLGVLEIKPTNWFRVRKTRKIKAKIERILNTSQQYKIKTRKYLRKLKQLETQLTRDWMENYLPYTSVVYPSISPEEVLTGSASPKSKSKIVDDRVMLYGFSKRAFVLLAMVMLNAFFQSFVFADSPFNKAMATGLIVQLAFIVVNIAIGWITGIDAFKHKRLTSIQTRRELFTEFVEWRGGKVEQTKTTK